MEYLDPQRYLIWKTELRDGRADPHIAAKVGNVLGQIHAATAKSTSIAALFPSDEIFHALRLQPYFEVAAIRHPDLASRLDQLVKVTASSKHALVHGDVSPKNILIGPDGPIFIDAECAWYGDPAFDLAFCLTHLLLKCVWNPSAAPAFLECFQELVEAYISRVTWEPTLALQARASALVPACSLREWTANRR